jgi:hypothetical protein
MKIHGSRNACAVKRGIVRARGTACVLLAIACASPVEHPAAQTAATSTVVDIAPCVDIDSAVARLDCYDALARGARAATRDNAPAVPVAPEPRAERARTPVRAGDDSASEAPLPDEIVSTVASLREIQPGRLEVELANGQVWQQTRSDRYRLQVGFEVHIYPTRFGGDYRLSAPALRGFVQVARVR